MKEAGIMVTRIKVLSGSDRDINIAKFCHLPAERKGL